MRYKVGQTLVHSLAAPKAIHVATGTSKLRSTRVDLSSTPIRIGGNLDGCVPKSRLRNELAHKRAPLAPSCGSAGISIGVLSTITKTGRSRTVGDFSSGRLDR